MSKHTVILLIVALLVYANWTSSNEDDIFYSGIEKLSPIGFGPLTDILEDDQEAAASIHEFAVADLNGDGLSDIIVAYFLYPLENRGVPILILINDGKGNFFDGTSDLMVGPIPQTIHPREIVIEDFNADGKFDVFIADHGYDVDPWPGNQNTLLLSTSENKLIDASNRLPQQSDFTHSATAGDIEGDGDLDLFIGNIGQIPDFSAQIWINDGAGNFSVGVNNLPSQQFSDLGYHLTSHLVDVNGDGHVDLFLGANGGDKESVILLNDGGGTFNAPAPGAVPVFSGLGNDPEAVDVQSANINGDGKPDLFVLLTKPGSVGRAVQVLINNGDGTFRDESAKRFSWLELDASWWLYLHLFDIDGDCDIDILTEGGGESHAFVNNGSGVFARKLTDLPPLFTDGQAFEQIDVNNDGVLDIVMEAGHNFFYTLNLAPACVFFEINAGHAGAWFNTATSGQGQFIDVDVEEQFMFVAWFTYTDAASENPNEQRWLTAQGNYSGSTAELALYETLGGRFDDPQEVTSTQIGEVTLSFSDCGQGQMTYSFDEEGLQGEFPLLRVIPSSGNVCEERSGTTTQTVDINAGMDGAWFDPNTSGQGFFIDSHPDPAGGNFIFVAWFTYGDGTASGQRWLTAQGSFEGSTAEIDVFKTTGGSFDDPQAPSTTKVGNMSLDFTDCSNAQLTYSLPADGAEGGIAITRVIPGGQALCEELAEAK